MTNETARALLHRHGLPEDVIDGALCLHAQELAAVQRLRMEELDLTGQKARLVGRIVDLIDPARTPAAAPAAVEPPADQTTPSHRAGLRDHITTAISKWHRDPEQPLYEQGADAVLAVLYREWPWLRAEAEDAKPADQAAVDLETARATNQRLNREKQRLESELAAYRRAVSQWEISERGTYVPLRSLAGIAKAAGIDVPARWQLHYERVERAEAELRRMADETATTDIEASLADGPVRCPLCPTPLTLHTPSGARAHFTTVHPEQRITGRESGPWPLLVADETATTQTQPRRGDRFEQWLKTQRDKHRDDNRGRWSAYDDLLDLYRLHADTGTPLGEHVCEARVVGDCECLEQPATTARQDGSQP